MELSRLSERSAEPTGLTFDVDDVAAEREAIYTEPLLKCLTRRLERGVIALPGAQQPVTNHVIATRLKHPRAKEPGFLLDLGSGCHQLMDAVHAAFSRHYPLTLTPDAIWLVIAQGFAHHVAENAETLRPRLVGHEGKRELTAKVQNLSLGSIEAAVASFSAQIRDATDPVLHENLICDFSTTTPAIRTASEVVLMDTFSVYFDYRMMCVCGIPKITLTGSVEDWQRIRARAEVLDTYEMGWWVARLRPILDEFVRAAEGHPTRDFWRAIYKPEKAYGGDVATGWIADLFPYLGNHPVRHRNSVLAEQRVEWSVPVRSGIQLSQFPSGLSRVPVKVEFRDGSEKEIDLVAGFLAVEQDTDLRLSSRIGWCMAEAEKPKPVTAPAAGRRLWI